MSERRTWPRSVREAAERLRSEDGLALPDIVRRLKADHGADVPMSTVGGWLQRTRTSMLRSDVPTALQGLAGRAVKLADEEMLALERHGRRPVDLERLSKLIALLRSIEALKAAAPKVKRKVNGLAELGEGLRIEDLDDTLSEAQIES